jgi:hypothetical protein
MGNASLQGGEGTPDREERPPVPLRKAHLKTRAAALGRAFKQQGAPGARRRDAAVRGGRELFLA